MPRKKILRLSTRQHDCLLKDASDTDDQQDGTAAPTATSDAAEDVTEQPDKDQDDRRNGIKFTSIFGTVKKNQTC